MNATQIVLTVAASLSLIAGPAQTYILHHTAAILKNKTEQIEHE